MTTLTLTIDDTLYTEVSGIATRRETTVDAMLRDYLAGVARGERHRDEALAELRRMSDATEARLGPDFVFDRASTYDR